MPKLTIDTELRTAQVIDGLNKISAATQQTANKMTAAFKGAQSAVAAFGVAIGTGAIVAGFKNILDEAENFNKLAQKTGISTEALSRFNFAAKLSDVSTEDLGTGLKKLAVNMSEAAQGSKEQVEVFRALGISVKDAAGNLRSTDDVLRDVSDRFSRFKDGPEKAAIAVALFGRSGDTLIPLLNNLRDLEEEGKRFG